MTMIERIARLLAKQRGVDPDQKAIGSDERIWELRVDDAREILTAMRQITKSMDAAGYEAVALSSAQDPTGMRHIEVWEAMISAALVPW